MDKLSESVRYVRSKAPILPKTAVVLGSGLGGFARTLAEKTVVECREIPYYPVPSIEGHAGKLIFGRTLSERKSERPPVLAFLGRSHYYESGDLSRVTYPIRLAHELGVRTLILTNAAGGINSAFAPGDLMVIIDQINMTLKTPFRASGIISRKSPLGRGAQPWKSVYDPRLLTLAREAAELNGFPLKQGVYCGVIGPSYETAAEIEMLKRIGADAVGMSTVHEATVASELGMRVLGISLITNYATGLVSQPPTHAEVIRVAQKARKKFERLLVATILLLHNLN